jgi:dGTP triphosphohydrolase
MGHDLDIHRFGHSGEDVINELLPNGFEHNVQNPSCGGEVANVAKD